MWDPPADYWGTLRALRRAIEARRPLHDQAITLHTAERDYHFALTLPAEDDRLLDEWVESLAKVTGQGTSAPDVAELHLPYWATPWASGFALGEAVLGVRRSVAGKRIMELGCGLGTTAIAALVAGADLVAADCFAEPLEFCRFNTLRNTGHTPELLLADWRTAEGRSLLAAAGPYEVVLAADVLYDEEDVVPLLELAPALLPSGGALWLSDPGRESADRFVAGARRLGWSDHSWAVERTWPAGTGHARITIHRFSDLRSG
jgi:predicted nicotinamide N-methyase